MLINNNDKNNLFHDVVKCEMIHEWIQVFDKKIVFFVFFYQ